MYDLWFVVGSVLWTDYSAMEKFVLVYPQLCAVIDSLIIISTDVQSVISQKGKPKTSQY